MGAKSQRKGYRIENEIVNALRDAGIRAVRMPLSGSLGGDLAGDVVLDPIGRDRMRCEIKARANGSGFGTIERWLGQNDVLILRRDRQRPIVVLPWERFLDLLQLPQTGHLDGPDPPILEDI